MTPFTLYMVHFTSSVNQSYQEETCFTENI